MTIAATVNAFCNASDQRIIDPVSVAAPLLKNMAQKPVETREDAIALLNLVLMQTRGQSETIRQAVESIAVFIEGN